MEWLLPALLLAAGTLAIWTLDLDRRVARGYFDPAGPPDWPVGYEQPWDFLYTWGVMPAMVVAVAGIALLAFGYTRREAWMRWAGLLILFSLLLGPFLLTNGVFHNLWGRPRPRQIVEFGGERVFHPVLLPSFRGDEPAFPTGHAAGGFSLFILYAALRPRSRCLAWMALGAGMGLGGVTAWARITQGGHFLSDGLWSAGVIWISTLCVQWALARWGPRLQTGSRPPVRYQATAWAAGALAAMALVTGYLAFLPIQERAEWRMDIPPGTRSVQAIVAAGTVRIREAPRATQVRVFTTLSGRGWPWAALWERRSGPVLACAELRLHYTALGQGMRRGGNVSVVVIVPAGLTVTVQHMELRPDSRWAKPHAAN
jgi:membrane-associated PAP2 superfamily phosphatase